MAELTTPASTPAPAGQAPDNNNQPAGEPGATQPAADNNQAPGGEGQQVPKNIEGNDGNNLSIEDINNLKRKAGRWDALNKRNRQARREQRGNRGKDDYNSDGADPALLDTLKERDTKIDELSSDNLKLQVTEKARNLLEGEEYKDIPIAVKKAVIRNPIGFTNPMSGNVDDMVADIQEYLDDEADAMASNLSQIVGSGSPQNQPNNPAGAAGQGNPAPQNPQADQTPPVSGSGPESPNADLNEGVGNKTGPARSTAVLRNILKKR